MAKKDDNVEIPLEEIYKAKYICLKCVKLRVNRKNPLLGCTCSAFRQFCFQWRENLGGGFGKGREDSRPIPTWKVQCWGFCGSENIWMDTLDEITKYCKDRGYKGFDTLDDRLKLDELVGLKELYYESTHPHLCKPPSNESCGTTCKIIKKNPMLDASFEDWRQVGNMGQCMGEYDSINARKKKKSEEAKKNGETDKSKDLKGVRKPNTGKAKECKTTDTTVIIHDVTRRLKPKKIKNKLVNGVDK